MLTPSAVSAIVITRGDVDLAPIVSSLIFDEVIIWDNSIEQNLMTYARYAATHRAKNTVFYSQDDDVVHTPEHQLEIIEAYEPGVLVGCMWDEWSDGAAQQGIPDGYSDLVFAGSGSVWDAYTPFRALARYCEYFPQDDFLRLWADTIVGVIAPTKQLDIRFEALPCAEDANRMCNLPDGVAQKTDAIKRARWIRSDQHIRAIA